MKNKIIRHNIYLAHKAPLLHEDLTITRQKIKHIHTKGNHGDNTNHTIGVIMNHWNVMLNHEIFFKVF